MLVEMAAVILCKLAGQEDYSALQTSILTIGDCI